MFLLLQAADWAGIYFGCPRELIPWVAPLLEAAETWVPCAALTSRTGCRQASWGPGITVLLVPIPTLLAPAGVQGCVSPPEALGVGSGV